MIKSISLNTLSTRFKNNKPKISTNTFEGKREKKNNSKNNKTSQALIAAGLISLSALAASQAQANTIKDSQGDIKIEVVDSDIKAENAKVDVSIKGNIHKHNRKIEGSFGKTPFSVRIKSDFLYCERSIDGDVDGEDFDLKIDAGPAVLYDRYVKGTFAGKDVDITIKHGFKKHDRTIKGSIDGKKVDFNIEQDIYNYDRDIEGIFAGKELNLKVEGRNHRYNRTFKGDFNGKELDLKITGNDAYDRDITGSFEGEDKADFLLFYLILREATDLGEMAYYNP